MNPDQEKNLFENAPVGKAIAKMALPTVIGQIILVLYNMADTFFIGLTGDDAKVTALTICMPAFMLLSAISNLFGVGGASVISRAHGCKNEKSARAASSFALWGCIGTTMTYALLASGFGDALIDLLGGTAAGVHAYALQYMRITVIAGGMGASVSGLLSHLIRAEGRGMEASLGIALGGLLNIALDPLFMFVLCAPGREIEGAAMATAISNFLSLLFFVVVLAKRRRVSMLTFSPRYMRAEGMTIRSVLSAGLPACIMTLFENVSFAVMEKLLSAYGILVQAGIGVAKKVNMLAHSIVRGMAQGTLPLIGYNYACGNHNRMKHTALYSMALSVASASVCMAVCLLFSRPLIGLFLQEGTMSAEYGAAFLRIMCIGGPFSACAYSCISLFQATGSGDKAFLLAILRKGVLDIPLMFMLDRMLPIWGAPIATPVADGVCCLCAAVLCTRFFLAFEQPERQAFHGQNGYLSLHKAD